MKKILVSISLLLYFVISTGFVVSVHYCMDQINAVELGHNDDSSCGNCGMMTSDDGCCKDEVKVVKWNIDQVVAKMGIPDISVPVLALSQVDFQLSPLIAEVLRNEPVAHGPPLNKQETYLQNCVFRI